MRPRGAGGITHKYAQMYKNIKTKKAPEGYNSAPRGGPQSSVLFLELFWEQKTDKL